MNNELVHKNIYSVMERILFYGWLLFLFVFPWQSIWLLREVYSDGVKSQYATLGIYATEGVIVLLFILGLCLFFSKANIIRSKRLGYARVTIVMLFFLYAAIQLTRASDLWLSVQTLRYMLEAAAVIWIGLHMQHEKQQSLWALFFGILFCAIIGMVQFFTQERFSSVLLGMHAAPVFEAGTSVVVDATGRWLRAYGLFAHPNIFGGSMVLGLFVCTQLLLSYTKKTTQGFLLFAGGICSVGLYLSYSRSAWLAAMVLGIALLLHIQVREKIKTLFLIYCVVWGILTALLPSLMLTRMFPVRMHETASLHERIAGGEEALHLIAQAPVLGVGIGHYTQALQQYMPDMPIWYYQPVHMVPLLFLAEWGIVGLLLVAALLIYFCVSQKITQKVAWSMLLVPVVPIMLFDHYLYSSFAGLLLLSLWILLVHSYVHSLSPSNAE